ncbi:nuclease domain-containing protein [Mesorhizobium sp. B2-3-4]|uniref:nuclease domain-containing protein n=1 Tax=Mesorhizobium sp. B2-3-4 TaxID=2589959 RepID=UPI001129D6A7|nr:nuclease domain-containing protein [Mesorhizobium sp. B2-3-4]TPM39622.1 DUF1364 domain-containing protein [Mesorhizobium sp. B2-3-4]
MGIVSSKLRNSAKGEICTFAIPGICNHDPETTVLCHIRDEAKGLSNKANDYSAAFGCYACHTAIDQHRLSKEDELFYSLRAMQRTWAVWVSRGLIVMPVDVPRSKPSSKIAARRHIASGETIR